MRPALDVGTQEYFRYAEKVRQERRFIWDVIMNAAAPFHITARLEVLDDVNFRRRFLSFQVKFIPGLAKVLEFDHEEIMKWGDAYLLILAEEIAQHIRHFRIEPEDNIVLGSD